MERVVDRDYVLCECKLEALVGLVEELEADYEPRMVKAPATCLTMLRAEDSIEGQEFYLGEAIATECEVAIDSHTGYGLCLGEEPERAYCLAVVDAVVELEDDMPDKIATFLEDHDQQLQEAERREFAHVAQTQVDFQLFDEE